GLHSVFDLWPGLDPHFALGPYLIIQRNPRLAFHSNLASSASCLFAVCSAILPATPSIPSAVPPSESHPGHLRFSFLLHPGAHLGFDILFHLALLLHFALLRGLHLGPHSRFDPSAGLDLSLGVDIYFVSRSGAREPFHHLIRHHVGADLGQPCV